MVTRNVNCEKMVASVRTFDHCHYKFNFGHFFRTGFESELLDQNLIIVSLIMFIYTVLFLKALFQNAQDEIFEIFKMLENNIKFTRTAC